MADKRRAGKKILDGFKSDVYLKLSIYDSKRRKLKESNLGVGIILSYMFFEIRFTSK